MSLSRYNKIYNISLGIVILYTLMSFIALITKIEILGSIISATGFIYALFAAVMLWYKIHLTRKYFIGGSVIINLIVHGVLMGISFLLILISVL